MAGFAVKASSPPRVTSEEYDRALEVALNTGGGSARVTAPFRKRPTWEEGQ